LSHQHRKLSESIRAAHYLKQILFSEAKKSEYSRGVYNGFEMISSILLSRDPIILDSPLFSKGLDFCSCGKSIVKEGENCGEC